VSESFSGFDFFSWMGLLGPARMPEAIVARLDAVAQAAFADEAFRTRVTADGTTILGRGPAAFREFLRADMERGREVVRISGARIE
jgi:tripartite-type tricarboxylate transporter receptor subunit TctC